MDSMEPKKLALVRILQILEKHSDIDHLLTQEDIAHYLYKDYGIAIERKAISRNLSLLKEADFDIESTKNGSYLASRQFENSELRLLIDGVLSSRHITPRHSRDLIDKLCSLASKYFRANVKNIHSVAEWNKTDNQSLFYNIELISEAIESGRRICFDYNKYGTDKKLHRTRTHTVSPYQLILHNQRYYLMAYADKWHNMVYFRVDRITNMTVTEDKLTPINTVDGYEHGINYGEIATALPYMFTDKPEQIVFLATENIVDQIVDWFGKDVKFEKCGDRLQVTVKASPNAMEFWAMQYLNCVEVLRPKGLRNRIKENIANAMEKYSEVSV